MMHFNNVGTKKKNNTKFKDNDCLNMLQLNHTLLDIWSVSSKNNLTSSKAKLMNDVFYKLPAKLRFKIFETEKPTTAKK